jgi:beta-N-acetylhexosaminidase
MQRIGAFITGCAGPVLLPQEKDFFSRCNPWGLILFKRNCESPDQLKELTSAFRTAVGRRDAPVLIDQEGGRVQRLGPPSNAWRKYPKARAYGDLYRSDPVTALRSVRNVGRLMAEELVAAGITVNCLPVLDLPQSDSHEVIGDRAYSLDREQVMALARAHAAGLLDGGVLPVVKHIPGHGRAMADSHLALPVVEASAEALRQTDFPPFAAFADAPIAMTAHVVFAAFDKNNPATLSRKIIKNVIRGEIGFRGLLVTDDLSMKALSGSLGEKCARALDAGCDLLLHCNGVLGEMEEVAITAGYLTGKALRRAKAAIKMARKPQPYDVRTALADLDALVSS